MSFKFNHIFVFSFNLINCRGCTYEKQISRLKQVLDDDEYVLYKQSLKSNRDKINAKGQSKNSIKSMGKNKLLSILHLALLMSKSQIQLCDLFRYAKR